MFAQEPAMRYPILCIALLLSFTSVGLAQTQTDQEKNAPVRGIERTFQSYTPSWQELKFHQIVPQELDYSCGAACICSVFEHYWGIPCNEEFLVRLLLEEILKTKEKAKDRIENGFTVGDLESVINYIGKEDPDISCKAYVRKVKLEDLRKAKVPLIVGIDLNGFEHFVFIKKIVDDNVLLGDPIRGNQWISIDKFAEIWQKEIVLAINVTDKDIRDVQKVFTTGPNNHLGDFHVNKNHLIPQPGIVRP